jgi:uracil-DNA glycosylase
MNGYLPCSMADSNFKAILQEVRGCTICAPNLPLGPRPVFQLDPVARILIAGQAPGKRVHETGIPFNDPSGVRLRAWLGVDADTFYDPKRMAIVPMGFCYPGTGKSGDLPPRPECAVTWRAKLLALLPNLELTVLIGQYAIEWHLGSLAKATLTETVKAWENYPANMLPIPHPSPRNNIWLKRNLWFTSDVIPHLQERVDRILNSPK